eukprot:Transcript_14838.p1 GENE.Transcript_14838~~Transcript_14838.p1  ORF type:complete len:611 (+),score=262.14 Transcript_14838:70-1902(+)
MPRSSDAAAAACAGTSGAAPGATLCLNAAVDTEHGPHNVDAASKAGAQFGSKQISFAAGVALLINNITGPGVPQLPNLFTEAGWLLPVLCVLGVWVMTTLSSAMYCEAMRHMPDNADFESRAEYSTIVHHYFGRRWYIAAQVGLNGALQSLNVISVIQSAQVMDTLLSAVFGQSYGLNLTPFANVWNVTGANGSSALETIPGSAIVFSAFDATDLSGGSAWGCHVVVSLGYVLTLLMAVPCGRWNLDDNMSIQKVAFVLTLLCWLVWIIAALSSVPRAAQPVPVINADPQTGSQAAVLGTILFNFGFVTTVPSWVNEKAPGVSINRTLWLSTCGCVLIFFAVGLTGAAAFFDVMQGPVTGTCRKQAYEDPQFDCANDLLQLLAAPPEGTVSAVWRTPFASALLKVSVYAFPIVAVVSSIPVFSIVIKYNLVENGFSARLGFLWGVLFPWLAAFPLLYMPNILSQFINFTSLLFVSFTDFIVPFSLYVVLQRKLRTDKLASDASLDASHASSLSCASWHGARSTLLASGGGGGAAAEAEPRLSVLSEDAAPSLRRRHVAFPRRWRLSFTSKQLWAVCMGTTLTLLSAAATVLTIDQGSYDLDADTCALVGS